MSTIKPSNRLTYVTPLNSSSHAQVNNAPVPTNVSSGETEDPGSKRLISVQMSQVEIGKFGNCTITIFPSVSLYTRSRNLRFIC